MIENINDNIFIVQGKIEDTKGVIRSRKSTKDRQHNWRKEKRINNDLKITQQQ